MKEVIRHAVRPTTIYYGPSPDNPQVLRVRRRSDVSGKDNEMDLDITEQQLIAWATSSSTMIQTAMPHLSKDHAEFLISGATAEEWADYVRRTKQEG